MGSRVRYGVWEFNARTGGWLEKGQGTEMDMSAWMDARENSVNQRKDAEAVYYMCPARDGAPALVPDLLASFPTSGGSLSATRRLVRYVAPEVTEPEIEPVVIAEIPPRDLEYLTVQAVEAVEALVRALLVGGVARLGMENAAEAQADAVRAQRALRQVAAVIRV